MAEIALHEYVQQMKQLIEEGRYDEVVAHGRHILEQYPKYLEVYRVLGEAMLEAGKEEQAENMFLRVLSGDPENFVAHAGMSVIYDRRGELDKALWHMERAFEISPDNPAIRNELRRLYGRKSGVEPGRLDLTPAALARLYARGGHYRRAIEEFRALLEEDPDRPDLQVALAEALWRNEQRIQAEELCLEILEHLPFCLKANLILGEIYTRTGRKEGQECLAKAEALDPENRVAATLFGDASPLPLREVYIERLEYTPPEAERPAWMPEAATEIEVAAETQIEIPAWLEEISLGGEAPAAPEEGEKAEVEAEGGLEVPSWLTEPGLEEPTEEPTPWSERPGTTEPGIETPTEAPPPEPAEIPEWLREMAPPEVREEAPEAAEPGAETVPPPEPAEIPDWLKGMAPPEAGEEAPEAAEPGAEAVPPPEPAEIPDWLKEMAPPEAREEVAPPTPPAEETEKVPEWLAEAIPSVEEEAPSPPEVPAEEEAPEWLKEPPTPFAEAPAAEEPASETPEWLEGEGLPSGDEALAWLESLAKGKEEELRAVAQAEAEARFAEIVGKPRPTEEPTPEETPPPKAPTPPAEPEVPERPEQPVEAPPAEQAASETPEWLEGEGLPSGDEALAWLESLAKGKEEELRAVAQAEAEARFAEIVGKPRPTEEPTPEETPPPKAPAPPAEPELPAWLEQPAEIPPAEEVTPEATTPAPEPAAEEMAAEPGPAEIPEWLAEATFPEEAPAAEPTVPEVPRGPAPEEETFGWTGFDLEEEAPPAPEAPAPPEEGFGWTEFEVAAEAEASTATPVEPAVEAPAPEPEVAPEAPAAPAAEAPSTAPAEPAPAEEVPMAPTDIEALLEYLRDHPRDHEARLRLARAMWQAGRYKESLEAYNRLLRANKQVDEVLADLEGYVEERRNDPDLLRTLGDAYMRADRLTEALEVYREALKAL